MILHLWSRVTGRRSPPRKSAAPAAQRMSSGQQAKDWNGSKRNFGNARPRGCSRIKRVSGGVMAQAWPRKQAPATIGTTQHAAKKQACMQSGVLLMCIRVQQKKSSPPLAREDLHCCSVPSPVRDYDSFARNTPYP